MRKLIFTGIALFINFYRLPFSINHSFSVFFPHQKANRKHRNNYQFLLCRFDSSRNDVVFFQFTSVYDCKHSGADQRHCNSPFPWFGSNRHYPYFRLGSIHTSDRIIVPREHSRLHSGMDNFEPARFGDASSSQWIFSIRGSHVDHRISVAVWCYVCGVPSEVLRPAVHRKATARLT